MRNLLKIFDRKRKNIPRTNTRGIGGSVANKTDQAGFGGYFDWVLPRIGLPAAYSDFSQDAIKRLQPEQVRELIKRANPIVAKACTDFADNVSSGYTYTADKLVEDASDSPPQKLLDDFVARIDREQGGLATVIEQWSRDMFTHGGMFAELVIDIDGKTPVEIKTLSAATAQFKQSHDPIRGEYYELGQRQPFGSFNNNGSGLGSLDFKSLEDDPTIQYRPIQSETNNPYGTPILDPAVFSVLMGAAFMNAFTASIQKHAFPNMLVTIDKQTFSEFSGLTGDPLEAAFKDFLTRVTEGIKKLKPGSTLVESSAVQIGDTFGSTSRSPIGDIKDIRDFIRQEAIIAVQSQPVLMGSNESVTETHAREQTKSYARLIRRAQMAPNDVVTGYFNLILILNDHPPLAEFKLNYTNTVEIRDQADTFDLFMSGIEKKVGINATLADSLERSVELGYMTEMEAKREWDETKELIRKVDIIPKEE